MMSGGQQERFFTKRQPAATPQTLDKQVAQVQEGIQGDGQVIPVREVTHLDSAGKARLMPSENGIERTVQPARNAQSGRRFRPKSGTGSRTTPSSRILGSKSISTRRMATIAPGSRGATARTAQSYVESANRQMDKGNYTAAIAKYKQALRADGNSTAAKARLGRARRAMQAENEIIANRR
jgi:tetratricopeptide (TPR) repeat protein